MELMLLVWLVDIILTLDKVLIALVIILTAWCAAVWLNWGLETYDSERAYAFAVKHTRWGTIGALIAISVMIPSQDTLKYMAGAYLVQSAYESDLMQEATPLAKRAVLNQLKSWAEDAPDLLNLLPQENQDVPTNQP